MARVSCSDLGAVMEADVGQLKAIEFLVQLVPPGAPNVGSLRLVHGLGDYQASVR